MTVYDDWPTDDNDLAAHVASPGETVDELASADGAGILATCENCGHITTADDSGFTDERTGHHLLLCQGCVEERVDDEIADEMTREFFGEPADNSGRVSALHIGDSVTILPDAAFARLGLTGQHGYGVIESVVTDTPPDPERGPLYHIRLTEPGASGWLGTGYSRNYADELASADGGGQLAPLSDARLAEIREHCDEARYAAENGDDMEYDDPVILWQAFAADIADLLAALDQQREREAALLAERERLLVVVRAVVSLPPNGSLIEPIYITRETYMQARAALAAAETGGSERDGKR